ncbi:MAG TPA: protein kinase [Gemmatimonadales bacterium]|nr:protein kinase [Gemmatimonadales bacterium]
MTGSTPDRLTRALADRYRIERELGQGGMATVYLAQDLRHDRKVAVKVLKPELAAVLGGERFVVEIKTTAALQHPHILPLFDSGTADGFLYYVMPYIQGETLRDKLSRETQLGIDEAVRITREVADALDYAHRHGVIHRDIKPENILLHDGRPMVADFGIALAVSAAAGGRMTETGLSLGTPHYMSPEQATAEKELTNRSDVYSLGCVLYEMLTGSPPHVGATAQQIVMKIVMDPVRPVTELRKTVPLHVAAAVGKAVEKLPADRFESAKAFAEALGNPAFGAGTIGMTAPSGSVYRQRNSKTLGLVAAIALLATTAALWGWLRPEPGRPVRWFSVALPDSLSLGGSGNYRLALSPDGERLAYAGRSAGRQGGGILLRRLDQLGVTAIPGTDGGVNPSFSPDGRQLAFLATGAPRSIRVVSLAGGPAITLTDSLVDTGGLAWGQDGYIYYDGHLEGDGIARVRETGGAPEIVTRPDSAGGERYHNAPAPLPNRRGVLFTAVREVGRPEASEIAVVDLGTGKHRTLTRGVLAIYSPTGHLLYITSDGTLMAAPFDQDRLALTGEGVAITGGVSTRGVSRADLALANGTLVYAAGAPVLNRRELVWVTRDGAATAVDPAWTRFLAYPRISPDGRRVALSVVEGGVQPEVWVKQLDRGPALRLTAQGGRSGTWFPNGQRILYSGPAGLQSVPADGSALPALVRATTGTVPMLLPEISPDGQWVSYSARGNLYLARISGDTARRDVAATPALELSPVISPNGRWIAYVSNESGQLEVYVRPFPETQTTRWPVSTGGGVNPRWRRDGAELFFIRPNGDFLAVPVGPGPVFTAGVPSVLFSAEPFQSAEAGVGYDVHPDGKRFLMLRQIGGARSDELILVENLPAMLQTRVVPR